MTDGTMDISREREIFAPVVELAAVVGPPVKVSVMLFLPWSEMRLASRRLGVQALPVVAGGAVTR